jgi:hypothetical protein
MECVTRSLIMGTKPTERIMIHADLDKFDRGCRARALFWRWMWDQQHTVRVYHLRSASQLENGRK